MTLPVYCREVVIDDRGDSEQQADDELGADAILRLVPSDLAADVLAATGSLGGEAVKSRAEVLG